MKLLINISIGVSILFNIYVTQAADITYGKYGASYVLIVDGTIEKGDYDKFMKVLSDIFALTTRDFHSESNKTKLKDPGRYEAWIKKYGTSGGTARVTLVLNSLGGDVVEAIKIGKVTRDMLLKTDTGWMTRSDDSNHNDLKCMSACFFIWASGIERSAIFRESKNPLGIHRLYFEKDYYKGLTSKQAEKKYNKLKLGAIEFLQSMGIPEKYVDKMFIVPSNEVYMLSTSEINSLEGKAPYYEELLFSRCGTYTQDENKDYWDCVITEKKNKCSNVSQGYLSYIKTKVQETEKCWRIHDAIERWKRMNDYFK